MTSVPLLLGGDIGPIKKTSLLSGFYPAKALTVARAVSNVRAHVKDLVLLWRMGCKGGID